VGCVLVSYEWVVRGTLLLWIPSPRSRVTCCLNLEQHIYCWVEHPSQAVSCIIFLQIKVFIYFCGVIYEFMVVHLLCVREWFYMAVIDILSIAFMLVYNVVASFNYGY
jgi:hypothetical protein